MPRGDGTGPAGAGRRRTKGFCMGFGIPGALNQGSKILLPLEEALAVKAGETGFQIPDYPDGSVGSDIPSGVELVGFPPPALCRALSRKP